MRIPCWRVTSRNASEGHHEQRGEASVLRCRWAASTCSSGGRRRSCCGTPGSPPPPRRRAAAPPCLAPPARCFSGIHRRRWPFSQAMGRVPQSTERRRLRRPVARRRTSRPQLLERQTCAYGRLKLPRGKQLLTAASTSLRCASLAARVIAERHLFSCGRLSIVHVSERAGVCVAPSAILQSDLRSFIPYSEATQALPTAMAPPPVSAVNALPPEWDAPGPPWLPDPAALEQPLWRPPASLRGAARQPLACESTQEDRPPSMHVGICETPAAVAAPAHGQQLLTQHPAGEALNSAGVSSSGPGLPNARDPALMATGIPDRPALHLAMSEAWQAQPGSSRLPVTTEAAPTTAAKISTGHGVPPVRDVEQPAAPARQLVHQPSFAAWVTPPRLPFDGPLVGHDMPNCSGPVSTALHCPKQATAAQPHASVKHGFGSAGHP